MERIKVLFVCLGNICRSPLGEAVFKDKVRRRNLGAFIYADSCGTANYHVGDSPDSRTMANAEKNGIRIDHCGRQFTARDLEDFDFILAMDSSNKQNILRLLKNDAHATKVMMMRDFDPQGKGKDVPDPYYGGEKNFQEVFEIVDRSTDNFLAYLEREVLKK